MPRRCTHILNKAIHGIILYMQCLYQTMHTSGIYICTILLNSRWHALCALCIVCYIADVSRCILPTLDCMQLWLLVYAHFTLQCTCDHCQMTHFYYQLAAATNIVNFDLGELISWYAYHMSTIRVNSLVMHLSLRECWIKKHSTSGLVHNELYPITVCYKRVTNANQFLMTLTFMNISLYSSLTLWP